jgi:hypothetical protein
MGKTFSKSSQKDKEGSTGSGSVGANNQKTKRTRQSKDLRISRGGSQLFNSSHTSFQEPSSPGPDDDLDNIQLPHMEVVTPIRTRKQEPVVLEAPV